MPLEGRCLYYALLGLTQAPGFAGGHDFSIHTFDYGTIAHNFAQCSLNNS